MKRKKGFTLHVICGENIIVAEGYENVDFSRIIKMNESAVYLWNKVEDCDFTAEDLASLLREEYEVDEQTALADAQTLIEKWLKAGIIEP